MNVVEFIDLSDPLIHCFYIPTHVLSDHSSFGGLQCFLLDNLSLWLLNESELSNKNQSEMDSIKVTLVEG